jgi:hypothetical protein
VEWEMVNIEFICFGVTTKESKQHFVEKNMKLAAIQLLHKHPGANIYTQN